MLKLHVIVTSTRPGRHGPSIARWFVEEARGHGGFDVRPVDLAEVNLPMFDEPKHPRFRDYANQHTKNWSAIVDEADAFVFVTPEYNYGVPPSFVNALDYLVHEWAYKPAGFVSYGGISGGTRATQMVKPILTGLKMMPIPEQVAVPFFTQHLKDGILTPPESQAKSAKAMLDELARWAGALKPLRAK